MGFDKKRLYEVFLCCVLPLMCLGSLIHGILLFWAAMDSGAFYAVYDPLPYLWNCPVVSVTIGFLVYFVGFLYVVREILNVKRRVKTENGI